MTPDAIKSAIELVIQDKLTLLWWTYFFTFFATILAAFIGSYIKVKGTNFATKEDFEEVLFQLKSQVTATEQIKADISHRNWKTQEWNTIRLAKLEELVNCAFDLRRLAQDDAEKLGRNLEDLESIRFNRESESLLKLEMLSSLYFPELLTESLELNINFRKYQSEISKSNSVARELLIKELENTLTSEDAEVLMHLRSGMVCPLNAQIPHLHQKFSQSVTLLSSKSKSLLEKIMDI